MTEDEETVATVGWLLTIALICVVFVSISIPTQRDGRLRALHFRERSCVLAHTRRMREQAIEWLGIPWVEQQETALERCFEDEIE